MQDDYTWLAELKCPDDPKGLILKHWAKCTGGCQGTGLMFPSLTEVCPYPACRLEYGPHPNHKDCHGTGRVPVEHGRLGLGLKLAHELGYRTIVFNPGFMSFPCVHLEYIEDGVVKFYRGRGGDDVHNFWHALRQAVEKKELQS